MYIVVGGRIHTRMWRCRWNACTPLFLVRGDAAGRGTCRKGERGNAAGRERRWGGDSCITLFRTPNAVCDSFLFTETPDMTCSSRLVCRFKQDLFYSFTFLGAMCLHTCHIVIPIVIEGISTVPDNFSQAVRKTIGRYNVAFCFLNYCVEVCRSVMHAFSIRESFLYSCQKCHSEEGATSKYINNNFWIILSLIFGELI